MALSRRVGSTGSKTRAAILDATEQILIDEGYAAVSSRSVAARSGTHPGNVHYYFPTLDDLFIAVFSRGADKNLEHMAAALESPRPLVALWQLSSDRRGVTLHTELMAAANHRKSLHTYVVSLAQTARRMQIEGLEKLLPQYELDPDLFTPALVAAAIQAIALLLGREDALGLDTDHQAAADAMERIIDGLEKRRQSNLD